MVVEGNIILKSCGCIEHREPRSANTYAANPV